jgi:hypothetical protein
LPSVGGAYSTTVSQDVRELDRLTDWRISSKGLPEPIAETPEQVCQIEHLDNYTRRRVDHEVDKELTNAEATSRIADLDRRVLAFLQTRGWTRLAARTNNGGIPDLTRCYKEAADSGSNLQDDRALHYELALHRLRRFHRCFLSSTRPKVKLVAGTGVYRIDPEGLAGLGISISIASLQPGSES